MTDPGHIPSLRTLRTGHTYGRDSVKNGLWTVVMLAPAQKTEITEWTTRVQWYLVFWATFTSNVRNYVKVTFSVIRHLTLSKVHRNRWFFVTFRYTLLTESHFGTFWYLQGVAENKTQKIHVPETTAYEYLLTFYFNDLFCSTLFLALDLPPLGVCTLITSSTF